MMSHRRSFSFAIFLVLACSIPATNARGSVLKRSESLLGGGGARTRMLFNLSFADPSVLWIDEESKTLGTNTFNGTVAIDLDTGKQRWLNSDLLLSVCLVGNGVVFSHCTIDATTGADCKEATNITTGKTLWKVHVPKTPWHVSYDQYNKRLWVGTLTFFRNEPYASTTYGYDLETGQEHALTNIPFYPHQLLFTSKDKYLASDGAVNVTYYDMSTSTSVWNLKFDTYGDFHVCGDQLGIAGFNALEAGVVNITTGQYDYGGSPGDEAINSIVLGKSGLAGNNCTLVITALDPSGSYDFVNFYGYFSPSARYGHWTQSITEGSDDSFHNAQHSRGGGKFFVNFYQGGIDGNTFPNAPQERACFVAIDWDFGQTLLKHCTAKSRRATLSGFGVSGNYVAFGTQEKDGDGSLEVWYIQN